MATPVVEPFARTFWQELVSANARFIPDTATNILHDKGTQSGFTGYFLFLLLTFVSACTLTLLRPNTICLWILEAISWVVVGFADWMPSKLAKFYYGVIFFGTGMCIHSRIVPHFIGDASERKSVLVEWMNILYLNLVDRVNSMKTIRMPSLSKLGYGVISMVLSDACIYLIREWIPNEKNVSPENREWLMAVTGAMWILFVLDVGYAIGASQLDLLGAPLPTELWHCHPLLSESLSEFWGVRWNPVVGKLLQDSFYKPLRKVGASRPVCVVATFLGSAVLHMLPAYIALKDTHQVTLIGLFFVLQGVGVLTEVIVKRLYRVVVGDPRKKDDHSAKPASADHLSKKNGATTDSECDAARQVKEQICEDKQARRQAKARAFAIVAKSVPYQFVAELLLIMFNLSAYFCYGEFYQNYSLSRLPPHMTALQKDVWLAVTTALGIGTVTFYYIVRSYIHTATLTANSDSLETLSEGRQPEKVQWQFKPLPLRETVLSLLSWWWAVAVMLMLLPLYSLPMLRVAEHSHAQSMFVGPLIRALWTSFGSR